MDEVQTPADACERERPSPRALPHRIPIGCGTLEYKYKRKGGGLVVSTQVRQSEGSGFKSRSGQIAYIHGVKTRPSALGTGDVPRGSDST